MLERLPSLSHNLARTAGAPELLMLLAATSAACRPSLENAPAVSAEVCASALMEGGNYDREPASDFVALDEVSIVGYSELAGGVCTVKAYDMYSPRTNASLGRTEVDIELNHQVKGLAYPEGMELETAIADESVTDGYLEATCARFGWDTPEDANMCAAFCPRGLWEGETRVLFTDACKDVVSLNGDSSDVLPASE